MRATSYRRPNASCFPAGSYGGCRLIAIIQDTLDGRFIGPVVGGEGARGKRERLGGGGLLPEEGEAEGLGEHEDECSNGPAEDLARAVGGGGADGHADDVAGGLTDHREEYPAARALDPGPEGGA